MPALQTSRLSAIGSAKDAVLPARETLMKRAMKIASIIALTSGSIWLSASVSAQTVYKSVDASGNITYTDRPVVSQPVEAVEGLEIQPTQTMAVAAGNAQMQEQAKANNVAKQIRKEQEGEEKASRKQNAEERAANCDAARSRLTKYSDSRRLYRQTPDGEREYLSDTETDSARADAVISVDKWCD